MSWAVIDSSGRFKHVPINNAWKVLDSSGRGKAFLDSSFFTGTNWTDLTDAGATTLHTHAATAGLSFVKIFTLDLTAASGSVAYTGVGFQPVSLAGFTANSTTNIGLAGFCDSALNQACCFSSLFAWDGSAFIRPGDGLGNDQRGVVTSLDADGFTISWTKSGAPGGTTNIAVLCQR
jgi:hypothetical protein